MLSSERCFVDSGMCIVKLDPRYSWRSVHATIRDTTAVRRRSLHNFITNNDLIALLSFASYSAQTLLSMTLAAPIPPKRAISPANCDSQSSPKGRSWYRDIDSEWVAHQADIHAAKKRANDPLWFDTLVAREHIDYNTPIPIIDTTFAPSTAPATPARHHRIHPEVSFTARTLSDGALVELNSDDPSPTNITTSNKTSSRGAHRPKTRGSTDTLPDDVFVSAFKHCERQEKQYLTYERDLIMYDKLRVSRLLEKLISSRDWRRAVVAMTPVSDPKNATEMAQKRYLLLDELEASSQKFESWRNREKKYKGTRAKVQEELRLVHLRRVERLEARKRQLGMSATTKISKKQKATDVLDTLPQNPPNIFISDLLKEAAHSLQTESRVRPHKTTAAKGIAKTKNYQNYE
ncbi:something about silencing, SAS, complex subunit 4-domain-containing protein [Limtongia smithiae]|uniref:something about silencing, SAS, complex subunit 4-domain-containing protein n=1 Tax=Limtongia smithiae TaxID=1125753 RepID=UPI0034CE2DA1